MNTSRAWRGAALAAVSTLIAQVSFSRTESVLGLRHATFDARARSSRASLHDASRGVHRSFRCIVAECHVD
jgi:hypothetical protein